jgi:biopolymer transport protein ExbB
MPDLWSYIEQAGTIGYILVVISIISMAITIERLLYWQLYPNKLLNSINTKLVDAFKNGDINLIKKITNEELKGIDKNAMLILSDNFNSSEDTALELACNHIVKETQKRLWVLDLAASIAPMFGILGTVSGIITSFKGMSGSMPDTGVMVAGISTSMLTTAIGLIVAILALIPGNYFTNLAYNKQLELIAKFQEYWGYKK